MALPEGQLETAGEMGQALRAGQVASVELVERAIRRADAWHPCTNAFSQPWMDRAMQEARRIDSTSPEARAALAGVPVAVKDLFDVAGEETTGCCAAYRGTMAQRDAPVIERIKQAGLVMLGKTNQHELAAGGTNLVSACGRTGNPWDPDRMTGGSSGGSAATVASGIVPWALGSNTGGSIRIPSSMCGIFGLKPTFGQIQTEGVMPLAPSLDCPASIFRPGDRATGCPSGCRWLPGTEGRKRSIGWPRIGSPQPSIELNVQGLLSPDLRRPDSVRPLPWPA